MITLYVYPTKDFRGRKALLIEKECEDGKIWFGISDAVCGYCDDAGIAFKDVIFKVQFKNCPDYITIRATSGTEFASLLEQHMAAHSYTW